MDALLILLGVLGFGAVIIAINAFFVQFDPHRYSREKGSDDVAVDKGLYKHAGGDRRKGLVVVFPLQIDGVLVPQDRRILSDRRS